MAKLLRYNLMFVAIVTQYLVFSFQVYALPYDTSFTAGCLDEPLSAQYGGGIAENPDMNEGLKGWTTFGDAKIEHRTSPLGNRFIVASERNESFHSLTQMFHLDAEMLYTFSGWVRVNQGSADVAAVISTESGNKTVSWAPAQTGCWSMMKGGLVAKTTGPAQLYLATNNTKVEIWADSISLQPFTQQEWKSHQQLSIKKFRQTKVKFHAVDEHGWPVPNATVSLTQTRHKFPLGSAINTNILNNPAYQAWFLPRFKYTVFENELKWYSTEQTPGHEDYSAADALVQFAQSNNVSMRGHNILWDDPNAQPKWVLGLSQNDLWAAAKKRVTSVVSRYRGKFIHWDVVNENLHHSFFEDKLGAPSSYFYDMAHRLDRKPAPFLNDYNTIEWSGDMASSPISYLKKIKEFRDQGYKGRLAIGAEGHFSNLNLPSVRAALDILAQSKLPIWVTELDFTAGPDQASNLAQILQELHAHDAVRGLMMWTALGQHGCYVMCLTDNNFKNLATGDAVDAFIDQLKHEGDHSEVRTTDSDGFHEAYLYHGDYEVQMRHPDGVRSSGVGRIRVARKSKGRRTRSYHFTVRG